MQEIDKSFMGINLRTTTVLILCVSACLTIPKIADATGNIGSLVAKGLSGADSSLTSPDSSSAGLGDTYIPPNFGGPTSSQHGSGTR